MYDFSKPGTLAPVQSVDDYKSVIEVLKNPERFGAPQHARAGVIVNGAG